MQARGDLREFDDRGVARRLALVLGFSGGMPTARATLDARTSVPVGPHDLRLAASLGSTVGAGGSRDLLGCKRLRGFFLESLGRPAWRAQAGGVVLGSTGWEWLRPLAFADCMVGSNGWGVSAGLGLGLQIEDMARVELLVPVLRRHGDSPFESASVQVSIVFDDLAE